MREQLELEVRCGYRAEAEILDDFRSGLEQARGLAPDDVKRWTAELERRLIEQRAVEASWSEVTHNDRIDLAFAQLLERGIVAEQDAGSTMSDGWTVVSELAEDHPDAWGAVFFHRQDVERGVAGDGLMLAFGAFTEGPDHAARSIELARTVCEVLGQHGVPTRWNGDVDARIEITPFPWRKRRLPTAE